MNAIHTIVFYLGLKNLGLDCLSVGIVQKNANPQNRYCVIQILFTRIQSVRMYIFGQL